MVFCLHFLRNRLAGESGRTFNFSILSRVKQLANKVVDAVTSNTKPTAPRSSRPLSVTMPLETTDPPQVPRQLLAPLLVVSTVTTSFALSQPLPTSLPHPPSHGHGLRRVHAFANLTDSTPVTRDVPTDTETESSLSTPPLSAVSSLPPTRSRISWDDSFLQTGFVAAGISSEESYISSDEIEMDTQDAMSVDSHGPRAMSLRRMPSTISEESLYSQDESSPIADSTTAERRRNLRQAVQDHSTTSVLHEAVLNCSVRPANSVAEDPPSVSSLGTVEIRRAERVPMSLHLVVTGRLRSGSKSSRHSSASFFSDPRVESDVIIPVQALVSSAQPTTGRSLRNVKRVGHRSSGMNRPLRPLTLSFPLDRMHGGKFEMPLRLACGDDENHLGDSLSTAAGPRSTARTS